MSKIIYDVIQRFEVENGVPRLVSTNIQVIEGGEDLLSLAISMLGKMGFYEKFEEKRTSQYIGYRLKNPGKGAKRYQLVLSQRQDSLYISIPQSIIYPHLLVLNWEPYLSIETWKEGNDIDEIQSGIYWIRPSKEKDIFNGFGNHQEMLDILASVGSFSLKDYYFQEVKHYFEERYNYCLKVRTDKLFPYSWQVCITSAEVLEEFITHFSKILMEKN
ncbi:hypothetical protein IQ231_13740 [Cuspidothrix issatschenkoi LEGE 03284]|uniref:hypothetical protein n=1 Tax=Cuspidothrix issatschenkoi TaxID=230752 RepID=UPI00187E3C2F|nr:hypothetical protein [Cuspidothrix issatschenkoi]MBE9232716.1 hypothetical protein [Cuspidothrix issatschenkoi LEGE 03284]